MSDYEFLSITRKKLVIFSSITLSFAFLISLIMIVVFMCQPKASTESKKNVLGQGNENGTLISVTDFLFDEQTLYDKEPRYCLFREQMKQWNDEQVMKYFIPPEEILRDYYKKKNDNKIKEIFEAIR